jgi:YVTN family beta-propeller protein
VIDGLTDKTTTLATEASPYTVEVNPATNKIYVANEESNSVTVIDGVTNGMTTVPTGGGPYALAVNPRTNKIYVANIYTANVTVLTEQQGRRLTTSRPPSGNQTGPAPPRPGARQ